MISSTKQYDFYSDLFNLKETILGFIEKKTEIPFFKPNCWNIFGTIRLRATFSTSIERKWSVLQNSMTFIEICWIWKKLFRELSKKHLKSHFSNLIVEIFLEPLDLEQRFLPQSKGNDQFYKTVWLLLRSVQFERNYFGNYRKNTRNSTFQT